jgi:hypothetical protein
LRSTPLQAAASNETCTLSGQAICICQLCCVRSCGELAASVPERTVAVYTFQSANTAKVRSTTFTIVLCCAMLCYAVPCRQP